ncbi:MAG: PorT family protein [Prevotellaceae bacterium]|jgi:hypothetical protein|nr:PorT family protein [Prevotellaceae bacterium]
MKKILLVAALVAACATAQAKMFAFGVKAGLEVPNIKTDDALSALGSIKGSTGFHAGVLAQVNIPIIGLGIQPEVLYVHRGVNVFDENSVSKKEGVSYLDVPLNITWGIDLKLVRPFLAVTPYISYAFNDVKTWVSDVDVNNVDISAFQNVDNFDYGIGFGLGVELFQHLQVMGRYSIGLKNLMDGVKLTNMNPNFKMRGFTLSVGYLF